MKKRITFNPAWVIFLSVIATLVILNFTDDEHLRNLIAGSVLAACFLLSTIALLVRGFSENLVK